jgi:chromatin assembly factor 1 subunit B
MKTHFSFRIAAHLPGISKPSICVRCNPHKYTKKNSTSTSLFKLDYRMIFAVATLDAVLIYDTENLFPIAYIDSIHYAELTDLTWYFFLSFYLI